MKTAAIVAAALLALGAPALAQVKLEGSGERRKQLDEMHYTPFDHALWGELSEWTGTAPTAESTKDKVVLIVTWSGWYRQSHGAMRKAQSLSTRLGEKGLVVVGVHHPQNFASGAPAAQQLGLTFAWAADANGKFRQALKVDQDPDFYIIDRAGNMRYADVDTDSVDAAVAELLAETPEKAAGTLAAINARKAAEEREARRFRDVHGRVKPGDAPTVDFEEPAPEAYAAVRWPRIAKFNIQGLTEIDNLIDRINKDGPKVGLPEDGWTTGVPNTKGKLVIVYMMDPRRRDTINIIRDMNRIQDLYVRDVVVIGSLGSYEGDNQQQVEIDPRDKADLERRIATIVASIKQNRQANHPIVVGRVTSDVFQNGAIPIFRPVGEEMAATFIMSSDGSMRYLGHPNTDNYHAMIRNLINIDPGVQARRKAEDAAAKSGSTNR
ncbi:MAG: TlpA family protein disulfide reductase [Phycisphaeraceae bacterium]|nr:TlpA family protein disulfide reductase [Phycisphaeraceae bacterium]MBX3406882.1 TlpA family protein disulfide reductase [Phycisphaeraceae bacterium]